MLAKYNDLFCFTWLALKREWLLFCGAVQVLRAVAEVH
jgi:hypothetical protein